MKLKLMGASIVGALIAVLFCVFYFSPASTGVDAETFYLAIQRIFAGQSPYIFYPNGGYFYAPWATVVLAPFALLNARFMWAIINAFSMLAVVLVARRWNISLARTVLVLLSPPMFYNLATGQIDALFLMTLFIPREWWLLVAAAKPQLLSGMAFGLLPHRTKWTIAAILTGIVLAISFLIFGNWIVEIRALSQAQFSEYAVQSFLKTWPLQLIVGFTLLSICYQRDDERLYVFIGPFLFKYASSGSFIGVVLAVVSTLKWWQAAIFVVTWWVVIFLP